MAQSKDHNTSDEKRLLIIANRLPLTVTEANDKVEYKASTGGLATGLASLEVAYEKRWIGWPGVHPKNDQIKQNIRQTLEQDLIHPVFISQRSMEYYYKGFSNKTIWPLFHYFIGYADYDPDYWKVYKRINKQFCDEVMKIARPNDIIWVHDYHLMLLPQMLRERLPGAEIGFFLHIPFPSYELYRTLPWRKELLQGLLGADLVGLHTFEYMRHFMSAVYRVLGREPKLGTIHYQNRVVQVDTYPMGIDYEKFSQSGQNKTVQENIGLFKEQYGQKKLILSVDRLDYSKGILQRLKALDQLLTERPEYVEQVSLIIVVVPSRSDIDRYQKLREDIDEMVGHINGKHATINWVPINYYYRALPFEQLAALYHMANIALVTPYRDGMNLVAKEFVASKTNTNGVLILSEMAGTAIELPQAIIINPNDINEIKKAIEQALTMPENEQEERMQEMKKSLQRQTVQRWANKFIKQLANIHEQQLKRAQKAMSKVNREQILNDFRQSGQRLILLDYDGTLVPYVDRPEKAVPDKELIKTLNQLSEMPNTWIVIISGRNHHTLDEWFGKLNVGLIAEHGSWYRESGNWRQTKKLDVNWKKEFYPIFQEFADKTPGSFVEEKPYSLVWHYRRIDAWIADIRAQELINTLIYPCTKNNLQILNGHKVVEVKVSGIDKGTGTNHWLAKKEWDFVLAIGDDRTDEDIFNVLPESAYSVKVGYEQTAARFNLNSHEDVRQILKQLAQVKKGVVM